MKPVFHSKINNINELRLTRVLLVVSLFLLMSMNGWAQPTATISGTTTVCQGTATDIIFTEADGTAPYTFTYTINSGINQTVTTDNGNDAISPLNF